MNAATKKSVKVETFECHETAHEPIEISQEAAKLIGELGLTGQATFLNKDADEKTKSRCPYRLMTAEESAVYRELCPQQIEINEYDAAPIPVRVLQIAAHAKSVIPNLRLMVWDKAKAVVEDPVLVGEVGASPWDRGFKRFILARWGSELDTFATLRAMAGKAKKVRLLKTVELELSELKAMSEDDILTRR